MNFNPLNIFKSLVYLQTYTDALADPALNQKAEVIKNTISEYFRGFRKTNPPKAKYST